MFCDRIALPSFFTGIIQLVDVIENMCILILHFTKVVQSEINDFRVIEDRILLIGTLYFNPMYADCISTRFRIPGNLILRFYSSISSFPALEMEFVCY